MGNCCTVEGAVDHWVYLKTGDRKNTDTDAKVRAILYDEQGNRSPELALDCYFKSDFERGGTSTFQAPPLPEFTNVTRVEMWREAKSDARDWYCELLMVNDRRKEKYFYFPVQRWMKPNHRYKIQAYDTCLPQCDINRDQRDSEVREKKEQYMYGQAAPDLPVQVRVLPEAETFSDYYKWDLATTRSQYLVKAGLTRLSPEPWENLEDLTSFYTSYQTWFPSPVGVQRWSNDLCFGAQRLIGCNPGQIKLCTELPENMGVTAEMLRPYLEGWTLKQIIEAKRLYVVDFKILEDLPTKDDAPICAPVGLFFVTGDKALVPIGIQLYQDIAPDNPVFLPNDDPFSWLLAKMWFNLSDASVHIALSHIGYTHLMMEGIAVAMHRNLSSSHPVFKLLSPHLLFLMSVNVQAIEYLVGPGGWLDENTMLGREGAFELIRRGLNEWRMDIHGNFPRDLESRGVLDPRTLPNYAYRDDGLLLHKAIDNYVSRVLRCYYSTPESIKEDYELQNFIAELALEKEQGGAGIAGVPNHGRLKKVEEIALVCTSVLFTCTAQHSAISYPQYDEYAFPPNYPAFLYGEPPVDKIPKSEEDIVSILPDQAKTIDTMVIMKLLSAKATKSLGDWEFQFQYDPPALSIEKQFREDLRSISEMIRERNDQREMFYKYPYLDPVNVPNFISM